MTWHRRSPGSWRLPCWSAFQDVAQAVDAHADLLEPCHRAFDRFRSAGELADDPALVSLHVRSANVRLDIEATDELCHHRLANQLFREGEADSRVHRRGAGQRPGPPGKNPRTE